MSVHICPLCNMRPTVDKENYQICNICDEKHPTRPIYLDELSELFYKEGIEILQTGEIRKMKSEEV